MGLAAARSQPGHSPDLARPGPARSGATECGGQGNWKMTSNWLQDEFPGEFGIVLRSIFRILRNAVPKFPGRPILRPVEGHLRFILASVYMVMVCVCTLFIIDALIF